MDTRRLLGRNTAVVVLWLAAAVAQDGRGQGPREAVVQDVASALAENRIAGPLQIAQQRRAMPGHDGHLRALVRIDTVLSNPAAAPAATAEVLAADWTVGVAEAQDAARYRPLSHRDDVWYRSTYWTGPDWTRVGKDWQHPGEQTASVRRFTFPRDGRVTVTGRAFKYHVDPKTDGVRLFIRHGAREVWRGEIDGGDAKGLEHRLVLDVHRGDALRFVVHKRGVIYCDTTCWDPQIAYDGGETFQASAGFSPAARPHGDGGWGYEMETSGESLTGLPTLHWLAADGELRRQAPMPNRPLVLSDRDSLPLTILADGADQGGLVLAVSPATGWEVRATATADGRVRVQVRFFFKAPLNVPPGGSHPLPPLVLGSYRGPWASGMTALQRLRQRAKPEGLEPWEQRLQTAMQGAAAELDLWAMVQDDWQQQDKLTENVQAYAAATQRHVDKTRQLLADLRQGQPEGARLPSTAQEESTRAPRAPRGGGLAAEAEQLERLASSAQRSDLDLPQRRALYREVRSLKRRIALANPLMQFGKLLFVKRVPTSYSHLVMQYYGWRARPGGGIFVLDRPGQSLACRDLLDGHLADGNVLEPRLSYDAQRIAFSFVRAAGKQPDPNQIANDVDEGFYHIWQMDVGGTGLRQLTSGPYDDLMPTYLPDGGIAFCSTRRRGYARCFGGQFSRRWHVYTLHRMDADGENIRTLSFHDTNEWFPAVSSTGLILYARWDYIDRDAVTHQNLWASRPDGTNPVAVWGNATPTPHCTFQIQPIPGSRKIVCTASAHHSVAGGSIAVVDPAVARDGQAAITRITPEIPFPEAESRNIHEYYDAPWPLSENYFLVAYSPRPLVWEPGANDANALGLYLLDGFGNRELIYRDPEIGSTNPCPLAPRPVPPVLPATPPRAEPEPAGEMFVADVYQGLGDVPRGRIKELRIVQIFPKTTHVAGAPPIGLAGEENGRAILGTVPVETDGSARFVVPAQRPLLFQALDAEGFAYQTMRSVTYVQAGERVSCVGCHESPNTAPLRSAAPPVALRRGPSTLAPGRLGGRPFSFVEVVQPLLDKHCLRCHGGEKTEGKVDLSGATAGGFTRSYLALCGDRDFWYGGTNPKNAAEALVPRFGARNQIQVTPPGGMYGALGSRLIHLLRRGHYQVRLSAGEFRDLAAWIDLNAIFYGVNNPAEQARQLRGELVGMPEVQ